MISSSTNQVQTRSSTGLEVVSPAVLTPDRHGNVMDPNSSLVGRYGSGCYKCGQNGHWSNNCPIGSKVIKARYNSGSCFQCKASIIKEDPICKPVDSTEGWVHFRCEMGKRYCEWSDGDNFSKTKRKLMNFASENNGKDNTPLANGIDDLPVSQIYMMTKSVI